MSKAARDLVQRHIGRFAQEGPSCVCFNLRKAARAITQLYDERIRWKGLRTTQLSILGAMLVRGPMTVSRLAEATVTDRTTLTRNLRLLERRRFIRVEPGRDRREREVSLTDRGREALARAYPRWKEAQAHVAKRFGRERLERLVSDLAGVVAITRQE
jgi:DNA-binding MarR family transcriptional regulator